MKIKYIISVAAACLLLAGCDEDKDDPTEVRYSDLFDHNAASSSVVSTARGLWDNYYPATSDVESAVSSSSSAQQQGNNGNTQRPTVDGVVSPPNRPSNTSTAASSSSTSEASSVQSSAGTSTPHEPPPPTIGDPNPTSVIYTDNQAVANLPLGDICYFPYKNDTEKTKYDHGYKVVFRTGSDTYLLGIFPHGECKWNDVNDMCGEIADLLEADCQMVGAPSLEDLEYFNDCGIYFPGGYEMWTTTLAGSGDNTVYFRNRKGAFYSTKEKSQKCGVCALIKVSAPQNDAELLSSFMPNYEETAARLQAEEEQYKLAIAGE